MWYNRCQDPERKKPEEDHLGNGRPRVIWVAAPHKGVAQAGNVLSTLILACVIPVASVKCHEKTFMTHLYCQADIRDAFGLPATSSAQAWINHKTFPKPVATYAPTRIPLFDPAEVEAWVAKYRSAYLPTAWEVQA